MSGLLQIETPTLSLRQFEGVITPDQFQRFMAGVGEARQVLAGRTIWNVNSTAQGGGVAEMLRSLISYCKGAGLDARWLVVPGNPEFFGVTKRIHNHLHGSAGDGGSLDGEARRTYEDGLRPSAMALAALVRAGDVVLLHDPQTAGLAAAMREAGAHVVWRCHVGLDMPNDRARAAWKFLLPYVTPAEACVFSRADFVWEGLDRARVWVIPPSIDAFSAKNRELDPGQVESILGVAGILGGRSAASAAFVREDGTLGWVTHRAGMVESSQATVGDRLVVQVSRWDRLKDPVGVIRGFADHVAPHTDAHLILAGPAAEAVSDDPEGDQVLRDSLLAWEFLPPPVRDRVHLATLPMTDTDENATLVNALQRKAEVVVQKSLAEGFGLTVAEAMWKGRPVVASRIGGIQDQVEDGRTGLLIGDPRDLAEYGAAVRSLLDDPQRAARMGAAARERVRDYFLGPRHLMQYGDLLRRLVSPREATVQPAG
jgi:trehalose synthase